MKIFQFLDRYPETNTIIVNGGDPLMMDPKYYWEIINYLDENDILYKFETGFRQNHSTDTNFTYLDDKVLQGFD